MKQHGCVNTLGGSHAFPAGTLGPRCLVAEAGQRLARGWYSAMHAMLGRALGGKALVTGLRRTSTVRDCLCIKEAPRAPQTRRPFCDIAKDGKGAPLQTAAPGGWVRCHPRFAVRGRGRGLPKNNPFPFGSIQGKTELAGSGPCSRAGHVEGRPCCSETGITPAKGGN